MANMHLVTGYAGQEHVTAADQGSFHTSIFGSGQFVLDIGSKLSASSPSNNVVRVLDGDILMQGRHIRLNEGNHVDLSIENGAQGYYRNDLIVARYTRNVSTGVEEVNLVVIKGTAAASNPVDPAYTVGDLITDHDIQNDMPLYRVPLNGLAVQTLVPLFTVLDDSLLEKINALNTALNSKAPASHNHSVSDITAGILPVARGGTGVGSLAELANALGGARVATGKYTGTGEGNGETYAKSLTFGFAPKFIWIFAQQDASGGSKYDNTGSSGGYNKQKATLLCEELTTAYTRQVGFRQNSSSGYRYQAKKSADGKTITWFVDDSSEASNGYFNYANYTYYYLAIG